MFLYNHKDNNGKTALQVAYELKKQEFTNLFKEYLQKQINQESPRELLAMVFEKEGNGNLPIHLAVMQNYDTKIANKLLQMVPSACQKAMLLERNDLKLHSLELAQLLHKRDFIDLFKFYCGDTDEKDFDNNVISYYYGEMIITINGNNILQEHVKRNNVTPVRGLKKTAIKVDGLWEKMLAHVNYDKKTAKEMASVEMCAVLNE